MICELAFLININVIKKNKTFTYTDTKLNKPENLFIYLRKIIMNKSSIHLLLL